MTINKRHKILLMGIFALAASNAARAETLPWLEDPFGGRDKIAKYGNNLRPVSCPNIPDEKEKFNLTQLVIISLCNNPDTKSAYLGLLNSADNFAVNYSSYLPTVTASADASRTRTFVRNGTGTSISNGTGVSASMLLYDFGQREFTIEAAEQGLIASGLNYDGALQAAIASAISAYYNLLTAQNAVDVEKENYKFAKESFEAAELKHRIGLVPLADELQARVSFSQAELAVERAENTLAESRASTSILMGLPADRKIEVAEIDDSSLLNDPFGGKVQELMAEAKKKRVDLEASRAGLESAKTKLKATKRSNLATISTNMSGGLDDAKIFNSSTTKSSAITLNLSIPIFTGFTQTYNVRTAETDIKIQEENLQKAELGVEKDVWDSWHNYETAKKSWEISWDQLSNATLLRDVALGRYKEGIGSILDVLSAQASYRAALQSHLSTRLSLLTSRVDLIRAVGALNLGSIEPETTVAVPVEKITTAE